MYMMWEIHTPAGMTQTCVHPASPSKLTQWKRKELSDFLFVVGSLVSVNKNILEYVSKQVNGTLS